MSVLPVTASSPQKQLLFCLVYCLISAYLAAFVGVYVNDFNSNKPADPPLRDIFIDNIPQIPHGFSVSDVSTIILILIWNLITIFHQNRILLMRRYFLIVGTFFFFRTLLVFSTTFPDTMGHECKPFINLADIQAEEGTLSYSLELLQMRMLFATRIFTSGGLSIGNGVLICGDYLFSGHTAHITTFCYLIREYLPKRFEILRKLTYVINIVGMLGVLFAHEHYLVDVFVGYFVTALMCKYNHLKSKYPGPKSGWIPGFKFLNDPFDRYVPNNYDTLWEIWGKLKNLFTKCRRKPEQIDVIV